LSGPPPRSELADVARVEDGMGCCGPAMLAAMTVFAVMAIFGMGVLYLVWTLLDWIGGMR
jgi:hypothetical protein